MDESAEYFKGIVLTDDQRQRLQRNMRVVLGEEYYTLTKNLFHDALNSEARYIVFLARRCFNLMNLFYRATYKEKNEDFEQRVLSDSGLLANIPSIAYRYIVFGVIPQILIIDDILIHGRGIDNLIQTFIKSLQEFMAHKKYECSYEKLERDVVNAITIRVMVQNNKPLLIKGLYYQRLLTDGYMPNIWEPNRWHELSSCISRLVSESIFSNTSFTLSLYDKDGDIKPLVENAAVQLGFIKSAWSKRFVSDAWVKPLKRQNGDIVAFYTLRITQNTVDDSFCMVPFVLAADIDINILKSYFENIDKKLEFPVFSPLLSEKVRSEFFNLILSYNLLLLIQKECQISDLIAPNKLDVDKILLNFGKDTVFADGIAVLLDRKEPFLSWEQIAECLINVTSNSEPLIDSNYRANSIMYQNIEETLEEVVASEGEEIERIAYLEYSGQKSTSRTTKLKPIHDLFSNVNLQTAFRNANDIADLVGNFLRQMDRGYVAVTTKLVGDNNSQHISCMYRAAEASQFIHSKKYSDYLPILMEMESDCSYICDEIVKRINKFYSDKPDLKTKLEKYTRGLYASGQKLMDWDINWLHWTEIDDNTIKIFGNQSHDDLLISQMILRSLNTASSLKQYRLMYPKY